MNTQKDIPNKEEIHPYYTKAAHIMYLSGALAIGGIIWTYENLHSGLAVFITAATLAFIFGMAYFAGKGAGWVKYVLMITFALGIFGIPSIFKTFSQDPVLGSLSILQTILQAWSIILLMRVPATKNP